MNSIDNLLPTLRKDFPTLLFKPGKDFHWSPKENTVYYATHQPIAERGVWTLLHEVAHAKLNHADYNNDFDLLKIESQAWQCASDIAKKYNIGINKDYIQDCLDTYRDWLYNRSKCPKCKVITIQQNDQSYHCFNCRTTWKVPKSVKKRITKTIIK